MAKMIPSSPPDFHGSHGEERLFQALRTLPDHITVLHSFRWIHPGNARSLTQDIGVQGEGDFVVFDPKRGVLVIEVKGGRVWCSTGEWFQQNRRTRETKRINPEAQASTTLYRLRSELLDRVPAAAGLVFGHAVWFPDGDVQCDALPLNYHPDMTFSGSEVAEPASSVTRAFNYWARALNRRTKPLSAEQAKEVLNVLAPSLSIVRSVRQTMGETEDKLVQLTQEQAGVVRYLDEQTHAAIHGAAGTGKTLVAVEKARRLASPSQQVLFLCYNAPLQKHLSEHQAQPNVEYLNFHGLVRRMVGSGGTLETATEKFLEYLADDKSLPYDHLIVDEAQDFEGLWLELLRERFRDGCFYAFYDRYQSVQGDKETGWLDEMPCRLVLTRNCRNTDDVAKFAYRVGKLRLSPTLGVQGPKPKLHVCANERLALQVVEGLIGSAVRDHKLQPSEVAVLPMSGVPQGSKWAAAKLAGIPVADQPLAGHITVTTPRRFKGLEASLVIIPDVNFCMSGDPEWQRLLYVAATRGRLAAHAITTNTDADIREAVEVFADTSRIRPSWKALCRQLGLQLAGETDLDPFD